MSEKNWEEGGVGGHRVCLGDIAQNITKLNVFADFPRGAWGELLQKLAQIEQVSIFLINFANCQLNSIVFIKEQ